jgi:threonyl-tRNA synthetase
VLDGCGDLRAEIAAQGSLGARIRDGRLVPFQAVIGPREVAEDRLSVRLRDGSQAGARPVEEALSWLRASSRPPASPAPAAGFPGPPSR